MDVLKLPNGFTKVVLGWRDRPDRDEKWADRERRSNPEFEREYELRWGSPVGRPVFAPLYKRTMHERELTPLRGQIVVRGWDFGFVRPAVVIGQFDGTGQLGIRHELLGYEETIDRFGGRVVDACDEWFGRGAVYEDYGDPAGLQRNDKSERTSVAVLKDCYGIRVRSRPSEVRQGLDVIRQNLLGRVTAPDGRQVDPGLVLDPQACPILSYGFARGYVRDEHDPEKPQKDGYYEHIFDALRYLAIHVLATPRRLKERNTRPLTQAEIEQDRLRRLINRPDNIGRSRRSKDIWTAMRAGR